MAQYKLVHLIVSSYIADNSSRQLIHVDKKSNASAVNFQEGKQKQKQKQERWGGCHVPSQFRLGKRSRRYKSKPFDRTAQELNGFVQGCRNFRSLVKDRMFPTIERTSFLNHVSELGS